ncbi:MAG: hypothetical protein QW041_01240 [Candidatus Pacearchaeota archaeon]
MKNKKGLTITTIVITIVIIMSFIILLAVVNQIVELIPSTFNKEACRDSVIARAAIKNLPVGGELATKKIPLKCKTEYICLTMGGECPTGYNKISVRNKEDINKEIANAIHDCWWMFGEGKLNFLSSEWITKEKCIICSIIAFDDKIQQEYPEIAGLNNYLSYNLVPNKNVTYLQYISNNMDVQPSISENDRYSTKEKYSIIFGYVAKGNLAKRVGCIVGGGAGATVGFTLGSVVPIIGNIAGTGLGFTIGAAGCYFGAKGGTEAINFINNFFGDYSNTVLLQFLQFNQKNIEQFGCDKIESIP